MEKDSVSTYDALLLYTQTKIDMANKFREGITIRDFVEFEKRLTMVDEVLSDAAFSLKQNLNITNVEH